MFEQIVIRRKVFRHVSTIEMCMGQWHACMLDHMFEQSEPIYDRAFAPMAGSSILKML